MVQIRVSPNNFLGSKKAGLNRDLNPGPLAPKARIIPLDHWPFITQMKLEGFEPPTFGSGIRRATVAP